MADLSFGTAAANSTFSPATSSLMADVLLQAQHAALALASVMELLAACGTANKVTAHQLAALLEPIAAEVGTLASDLQCAVGSKGLQ